MTIIERTVSKRTITLKDIRSMPQETRDVPGANSKIAPVIGKRLVAKMIVHGAKLKIAPAFFILPTAFYPIAVRIF